MVVTATVPSLRIRRMPLVESRSRPDDAPNPFEAIRRHVAARPLRIGLHSGGLGASPSPEDVLIRSQLSLPRASVVDVFRSDGPLPAGVDPFTPTVGIDEEPGGVRTAVRLDGGPGSLGAERVPLNGYVRWRYIAGRDLGDRERVRDLIWLEALGALGADLVVTESPILLGLRDESMVRGLRLVTPGEALVLVGLWSRAAHRAFVEGPRPVSNATYDRALADAIAPAVSRAVDGFARSGRRQPAGRRGFELSGAVSDRLQGAVRALDRLLLLWQCATTADTIDEMLDEFDRILTGACSIYEIVSKLVGSTVEPPGGSPDRAAALASHLDDELDWLEMLIGLRDAGLQRARVRPIAGRLARRPDDARVWLEGPPLGLAVQALETLTSEWHLADWGFESLPQNAFERLARIGPDRPESSSAEVVAGPAALLDPVVFAPRVVAHVAEFANRAFESLEPEPDRRLAPVEIVGATERTRRDPVRSAHAVVLSSPLSGLVDWIAPLR
jgi:hypothetical protein